jgi:hypothetical protein
MHALLVAAIKEQHADWDSKRIKDACTSFCLSPNKWSADALEVWHIISNQIWGHNVP